MVTHFATEESLMERHNYPDAAAHKMEHHAFYQRVQVLQSQATVNGLTHELLVQIHGETCAWLLNHISQTDVNLGLFLVQR